MPCETPPTFDGTSLRESPCKSDAMLCARAITPDRLVARGWAHSSTLSPLLCWTHTARISNTGPAQWRATLSATLPSTQRSTPDRP
jgi:hypothetical protein